MAKIVDIKETAKSLKILLDEMPEQWSGYRHAKDLLAWYDGTLVTDDLDAYFDALDERWDRLGIPAQAVIYSAMVFKDGGRSGNW